MMEFEKHWAMRKSWLPELPERRMLKISTWQGPHPSEAFKDVTVWYRQYYRPMQIDELFKKAYGDAIKVLVPSDWILR